MTKRILIILGAISLVFLVSCGKGGASPSVSVKQTSEYGYLALAGNMNNREALINGYVLGVDPEDEINTFRLKRGSHILIIRSKNRILLETTVEILPNETVEVTVP